MSSSATICDDHAADFRRFAMLDRYTEAAASQVASDIFKHASGEVRKRTSSLDMSDHARYRPISPDAQSTALSPAAKPLGGWRRCTISPTAAGERAGPAATGYSGRPIGGSSAPQSAEILRGRYDALEGQLSGLRNLPTQLEVAPERSKRVRPSAARRRQDPRITSSRC